MSSVAAMAAETETGKVRSSAAWCRRGGGAGGRCGPARAGDRCPHAGANGTEVAGGDRAVHHGGAGLAGNGGGTRNSAAAAAGSHGNTANPGAIAAGQECASLRTCHYGAATGACACCHARRSGTPGAGSGSGGACPCAGRPCSASGDRIRRDGVCRSLQCDHQFGRRQKAAATRVAPGVEENRHGCGRGDRAPRAG